mgnify:CR=1 FL=1
MMFILYLLVSSIISLIETLDNGIFFLMRRRPPRSTQSRSSAASDVYKRQVLEDLLLFRDDVNAFADLRLWMDSDSTIHLLSDLDLSSIPNWIPIGLHTNAMIYSEDNSSITGVFNGNNHTISNLRITQNSSRSAGLFGYVRKATVQDLTLDHTCSITLVPGQFQSMSAAGSAAPCWEGP